MDIDKPKDKIGTKQVGQPGLPNTTRLPGQPGSGLGTTGQPNPYANPYTATGTGLQPGGTNFGTGRSPGAGLGAGAPAYTNTPGSHNGGSSIMPSVGPYSPAGGTGAAGGSYQGSTYTGSGYTGSAYTGTGTTGAGSAYASTPGAGYTPPPVGLTDVGPMPPPAPGTGAGTPVLPPGGPTAPIGKPY
jgi:hypothetical protein